MHSRPKTSDVNWMTVSLVPITRCEPPEGQQCFLATRPSEYFTTADAKRHALEHPGHCVFREQINRTSYVYEPDDAEIEH